MLEQAEQGHTLSERAHDAAVRTLRSKLLTAHFALRETRRQVIVVVSGADGAGKGELVHRFNEWLDPRGVATHAFWDESDESTERPHFWRFWQAMPGAGRVALFFGSWYTRPIVERVAKARRKREFGPELDRIVAFERMLCDGGTHFLKLWLHLSKDAQRKRLRELEKDGRLGPDDWDHFRRYDRFREVSERAIEATHTEAAPWHAIDATDKRWREVTCGRLLLKTLEAAIGAGDGPATGMATAKATAKATATATAFTTGGTGGTGGTGNRRGGAKGREMTARGGAKGREVTARAADVPAPHLDAVDLTQRLTKAEYDREMDRLSERLARLAWAARDARVASVLSFEGWDAAGKGSAIRRVTAALDPRLYRVVGIAAPTDEERAQHYLWRFWRQVPRDGRLTIFDRSWYGRVLVERVEGFARPDEWERAYTEINDFERQLTDHGMALAKFFLHISPAEQLRRFKERERVVYKRFKITPEDWRNREKLPAYRAAIEEMLARCSPASAPYTIVAGNDKRFARVQILRTIVERLERALG